MALQLSIPSHQALQALAKNKLLPIQGGKPVYITCCNCSFVNNSGNNFCTNCGYPHQPEDGKLVFYNHRLQQRKDFRKACERKINHARNTLYALAAGCSFGIAYLLSDKKDKILVGIIMMVMAAMYLTLGRWSLRKPFTSLLISLLLMLTFIAINAWIEFASMFASASGIYFLVVQLALTYFLVQGVKAAFHAEVLEEQCKV